jgi:hypothetical protein
MMIGFKGKHSAAALRGSEATQAIQELVRSNRAVAFPVVREFF